MAGFWAGVGREIGGASSAAWSARLTQRGRGALVAVFGVAAAAALASHDAADPSWNAAAAGSPSNWLGAFGANLSDAALQSLGLAAWAAALLFVACGLSRLGDPEPGERRTSLRTRAVVGLAAVLLLAAVLAAAPEPGGWPYARGLGGFWGESAHTGLTGLIARFGLPQPAVFAAGLFALLAVPALIYAVGLRARDLVPSFRRASAAEPQAELEVAPAAKVRAPRRKAAPIALPDPESDDELPPFALDDAEDDSDPEAHPPAPASGPRVSGVRLRPRR